MKTRIYQDGKSIRIRVASDATPQETYADIGGLDNQIQEIKVWWGPGLGFQSFGFL